eukprot:363865-Chlamydomonas_euryale.AAC.5
MSPCPCCQTQCVLTPVPCVARVGSRAASLCHLRLPRAVGSLPLHPVHGIVLRRPPQRALRRSAPQGLWLRGRRQDGYTAWTAEA